MEVMRIKNKVFIVIILVFAIVAAYMSFSMNKNYITLDGDIKDLFYRYITVENIEKDIPERSERKGIYEPAEESTDEMEWVYEYDDMEYVFRSSTGERIYLVIKGDSVSLGKEKISIGSERSLIETVFKNSIRPKPPLDSFAYYDDNHEQVITEVETYCDDEGLIEIGFEYDENDCVKYIFIGYGPNA